MCSRDEGSVTDGDIMHLYDRGDAININAPPRLVLLTDTRARMSSGNRKVRLWRCTWQLAIKTYRLNL
jgi:hypothetical protein